MSRRGSELLSPNAATASIKPSLEPLGAMPMRWAPLWLKIASFICLRSLVRTGRALPDGRASAWGSFQGLFQHDSFVQAVETVAQQADSYAGGQVYVSADAGGLDHAGNQKKQTGAAGYPPEK